MRADIILFLEGCRVSHWSVVRSFSLSLSISLSLYPSISLSLSRLCVLACDMRVLGEGSKPNLRHYEPAFLRQSPDFADGLPVFELSNVDMSFDTFMLRILKHRGILTNATEMLAFM